MTTAHTPKPHQSETVVEALREGAKGVAAAGSDVYQSAVEQSRAAGRQATEYVRTNPWLTIGLAAGAGFLVGLMLRRR
jgi:ElaB/YqjD/DUF883 family membrane-anchored ribosome-binding protein